MISFGKVAIQDLSLRFSVPSPLLLPEWYGQVEFPALHWLRGDHVSERSQWARPKTKAKKKDMCDVPSKCDAHVGGEGRFKRHKAKFLDAGYV